MQYVVKGRGAYQRNRPRVRHRLLDVPSVISDLLEQTTSLDLDLTGADDLTDGVGAYL